MASLGPKDIGKDLRINNTPSHRPFLMPRGEGGSVRQMARDFKRNAANSARKDLRNLMDNVAGAPGIPQDDALFTENIQNQANPE